MKIQRLLEFSEVKIFIDVLVNKSYLRMFAKLL